jgi:hypothetical protein
MTEQDRLKSQWRGALQRIGEAGRQWRKSLVSREPASAAIANDAVNRATLRDAIKALRRARAEGHWSFNPERLRRTLALYVSARRQAPTKLR